MPAYNCGEYVAQAVASILGQSFSDFEFLIVDDGSTDDSLQVLREFASTDPRIRLISRSNRGLVPTLNEMLGLARGEFIARMDGDDIADVLRFERQVAFLRTHPSVVCVGGQWRVMDEKGRFLIEFGARFGNEEIQRAALAGDAPLCHPAVMMRREALIEVGGYVEENYPAEDLDLWLRLGEVGELENLPDVVLSYRVHANSVSAQHHERQLAAARRICEEACQRRGVTARFIGSSASAASARTRGDVLLRNGWWAFYGRQRRTAASYALSAIRAAPLHSGGWRLLACALLKRAGSEVQSAG